MDNKTCLKCLKTLNISAFTINRQKTDQLSDYCKQCHATIIKNSTNKTKALNKEKLLSNTLNQPELKKRCRICKTLKPITSEYFYIDLTRSDGFNSGCKDCFKILQKSPNRIYNFIKSQAKQRNIVFNLSRDEYKQISSMPCFYCGSKTDGWLDRKDNNSIYDINSVVSSCKLCNRMKYTLHHKDFINHAIKISNNHSIKL